MPLDDASLYKEMDPGIKASFLKHRATFESTADTARNREAKNP